MSQLDGEIRFEDSYNGRSGVVDWITRFMTVLAELEILMTDMGMHRSRWLSEAEKASFVIRLRPKT